MGPGARPHAKGPGAIMLAMSDFYSGRGDDGTMGVLGEGRIPKHHPRAQAIGAIDEAAASLGMARAISEDEDTRTSLETLQRHLYRVMAEVAAPGENAARFRTIGPDQVRWAEAEIDRRAEGIDAPEGFILGGDTLAGSALDQARTIVRRAERHLSRLLHEGEIENASLLAYLNRVSSLCFVLILIENQRAGIDRSTPAKI